MKGTHEPPVVRGRISVPRPFGVRRPRLVDPLVDLGPGRAGVVVAPAGAGKTTLLSHVAAAAPVPVAWLRLDGAAGDIPSFLAHLEAALGSVLSGLRGRWSTADDAVAELELALGGPVLLVIDDIHTIGDQPCAHALATLIEHAPVGLRLLLSSRRPPGPELHRQRLAGAIVEIDADALRFRTWEVEELFRDVYGTPLHAGELGQLTQRTDGWAAGLQMFHLATQDRSASERARVLAGPALGIRLTRDYLASTVLTVVPADLREFLVRTSVFDELTPSRCDRLLESSGSAHHLTELERRGLFTTASDDGRCYRYHEVLRTHLLETLTFELGEEESRTWHRQAAGILEGDGALSDALRAFSRSGAWDEVARLLGQQGEAIAEAPGTWIDVLPASIRDQDPWVLLALARRMTSTGSLHSARRTYRQALDQLGADSGSGARTELRSLESWMRPESGVRPSHWVPLARQACLGFGAGDVPASVGTGSVDLIGTGIARLIRGELPEAVTAFSAALERLDSGPVVEVGALVGRGVSLALSDDAGAPDALARALAAAEKLGYPALTRVAMAAGWLVPGPHDTPSEHLLEACARDDDRWGEGLVLLLAGLGRLGRGGGDDLGRAAVAFGHLGAPALQAWAEAADQLEDLSSGGTVDLQQARAVERRARSAGPLPYALALAAVAECESSESARARASQEAEAIALRYGASGLLERATRRAAPDAAGDGPVVDAVVDPPAADGPAGAAGEPDVGRLTVSCLGGFVIRRAGEPVALAGLRPQHLTLLQILGLHANRVVHRERLAEWAWPGRGADRSGHNLQAAVSALRRVLDQDPDREATSVARERDGYRLALASDCDSDVRELERRLETARRQARAGDDDAAALTYRGAVEHYGGELLPEVGPAEWAVDERDRLRAAVAGACEWLAEHLASTGDHVDAARLARRGLDLDRYRDGLWRRAIGSASAAGNPMEARSLQAAYDALCAELEVPPSVDSSPAPVAR